ncbi:hypothetical protein JCM10213_007919 [Rhodosporidiobolus nylandii]
MDSLFDWPEAEWDEPTQPRALLAAQDALPHLPTSPVPSSREASPAASAFSWLSEGDRCEQRGEVDEAGEAGESADEQVEGEEVVDDGEHAQPDDLQLFAFDDEDDLPGLSYSSPSNASDVSLEALTPPGFDSHHLFDRLAEGSLAGVRQHQLDEPKGLQLPTQAEMDAFFGFVDPSRASRPSDPEEGVKPQPTAPEGKSDSKRAKRWKKDKPSEREYYQLEPIPTLSGETGQPLSKEEKRLAIIASLQRLALSVFSQIVDNVAPPPLPAESQPSQQAPPSHYQQVKVKLVKRSRSDGEEGTPSKQQLIAFPRKCGQGEDLRLSGRELASLLKVVELIVEGLDKRIVSTKRDLYYRDVALFLKQHAVDTLVEDIAATLQVRRSDLNVVAAAKGLFAGALTIVTSDGKELAGDGQGALVPPGQAIEELVPDDVSWVLVVEKEAVFQTLCTSPLLGDANIGNGILLAGKGYPDLATRELVKRLSDELPSVPLLALVDADPHGLEILSTYRFGSASLSFDAANLVVDRLEWLGVKGTEWDTLGIDRDELLSLSKGDRAKAAKMLKREWLPEDWRRELEYMLHLGRKAEIQVLSTCPDTSSSQPSQPDDSAISASSNSSRLVEYVKGKILAAVSPAEDPHS